MKMPRQFLLQASMILLVYSIFFVESAFAALNKKELAEINKRVNALVILLSDNSTDEYPEARNIAALDLDNDGHKFVATLFTIEGHHGGNGHVQYLAIFVNIYDGISKRQKRLTLLDFVPVGSKGWRSICCISSIRLVQDEVELNLNTKEYGPHDGACCPSVESLAVYRVKPEMTDSLREIKAMTAQPNDAPHSECCR
jgi:hypothetical protein